MGKSSYKSMWVVVLVVFLAVTFTVAVSGFVPNNLTLVQSHITENLRPAPNSPQQDKFRFPPQHFFLVDDTKTDRDFGVFIQKLRQAVDKRNVKFIRSLVTPETRFNFGQGLTLVNLDIDNSKAPFWLHLQKAIAIGCSKFETSSPQTPNLDSYIWHCPPLDSKQSKFIDVFEQVFIVGEQIKIRAEPSNNSSIVGIISYEVVEFDYEGRAKLSAQEQDAIDTLYGWIPVILSNGQRGYVRSQYAYQIIGYRVYLVKSKGQWRLMSFLAGD